MTKAGAKCRHRAPDGARYCWLHAENKVGVSAIPASDPKEDSKSSFSQDVWKIVIDKLLIAVIVLLASTFATNIIESLKNDRSVKSQIDVLRAGKIAETWESVYALEDNYAVSRVALERRFREEKRLLEYQEEEIKRKFADSEKTDQQSAEAAQKALADFQQKVVESEKMIYAMEQKFTEALRATQTTVAKNRFWLGDEDTNTLREYIELFMSTPPASATDDETQKFNESLKEKIASKRLSIIQLRDKLLSH